ncbi:hypothetical protein Q2941_43965 [Bradyrhizobium sp. UFLA05-153]
MRAQFLYFPFDSVGLARIDPAMPIEVSAGPAAQPDWMRVRFKVTDPATPLPFRPVFSGQLMFLPDPPTPTRTLPAIDFAFQWTATEYDSWQTTGRVGVTLDPLMFEELRRLVDMPALFANRIWFWPARIPQGLLYGPARNPAKTNPMFKHTDIRPPLGPRIAKNVPAWPGVAAASFLSGDYAPQLKWDANNAALDGLAQLSLPVFDPLPDGTVEFWIATALASEDVGLSDGALGTVEVTGALLAGTTFQPENILNASIPVRQFLTSVRLQMIEADATNALAEALLPSTAPTTVPVRFSLIGTQDGLPGEAGRYLYGMFANAKVRVRNAAGAILQDRALPLHGQVTITLPTAAAELPATIEVASTKLEVASSPIGSGSGPWTLPTAAADAVRFALGPIGAPEALVTLLTFDLQNSLATREITRKRLDEYDARLRPTVWPAPGIPTTDGFGKPVPATQVFVGSREPFNLLNVWELRQIFRAVSGITGLPAGVTKSVAHALILWFMEGKLLATSSNVFGQPAISQARHLLSFLNKPPFNQKPPADYENATPGQMASLFRMFVFYQMLGLDDFNHHAGAQDNLPAFDAATPIATLAANHDAAFDTARARIVAASLNPPDRATVTGAFTLTKSGSGATTDWQFRCTADCVERLISLQYCEFLRRVLLLPANVMGTANDANGNPFDIRRYPAFAYMAFNGGISVSRTNPAIDPRKRVFVEWTKANAEVGTPGCPETTPEGALLCTKVTSEEIQFMAQKNDRRGSARLNGIQFGALASSYGRVFPARL